MSTSTETREFIGGPWDGREEPIGNVRASITDFRDNPGYYRIARSGTKWIWFEPTEEAHRLAWIQVETR
jgi:hypothetical protein